MLVVLNTGRHPGSTNCQATSRNRDLPVVSPARGFWHQHAIQNVSPTGPKSLRNGAETCLTPEHYNLQVNAGAAERFARELRSPMSITPSARSLLMWAMRW